MSKIKRYQINFITFIFKRFKVSTFAFFTSAFSSVTWSSLVLKTINKKEEPIHLILLSILLYAFGIFLGLYLITLLEELKEKVDAEVQALMKKDNNFYKLPEYKDQALTKIFRDDDSQIKIFWITVLFVCVIILGYVTSCLINIP
jgi:hypothetical protein